MEPLYPHLEQEDRRRGHVSGVSVYQESHRANTTCMADFLFCVIGRVFIPWFSLQGMKFWKGCIQLASLYDGDSQCRVFPGHHSKPLCLTYLFPLPRIPFILLFCPLKSPIVLQVFAQIVSPQETSAEYSLLESISHSKALRT